MMDTNAVWQVALAVIASLGGGGAIVFALSGYLGKRWADRALEKQKQDYAQLNLAFSSQLDIATRRLQIELDAQGLLHKLRIESEFEKIKELWKRMVTLNGAFWSIPKSGGAFVSPNAEVQHKFHVQASDAFIARYHEAHEFWSKETLSIPKNIADLAGDLLKIALEEVMQTIQYSDPFDKQTMAMFNEKATVAFFDSRNENIKLFDAKTKELEQAMRDYIDGNKKP